MSCQEAIGYDVDVTDPAGTTVQAGGEYDRLELGSRTRVAGSSRATPTSTASPPPIRMMVSARRT